MPINNLDDLVDQKKLAAFQDKVYKMAREEFGTDDEGKINKVQITCLDRTRFRGVQYFPVPYDHKAETAEEREEILSKLLINLGIATSEVKIYIDLERHDRTVRARKEEKKR